MVTYGSMANLKRITYSTELEKCEEDYIPEMLDLFEVGDELTFADLKEMGLEGKVHYFAKVIQLFESAPS